MALKRWLWFGVPAVVAAALAVALLPARPYPDQPGLMSSFLGLDWYGGWYYDRGSDRSILERDAKFAANAFHDRVAQGERGDSLIALARPGRAGLRSPDESVTVLYDPALALDTARRVLGRAVRELALYPRVGGSGMPVIIALYADSARHPDLAHRWWRRRSYVRSGAAGSACIVEINRTPKGERYGFRMGGWPLDGCAVYARFGVRGGNDLGRSPGDPGLLEDRYSWQNTLTEMLVYARRQEPPRQAPWDWQPHWAPLRLGPYFGVYAGAPFQWRWSACLGGSDTSCLAAAGLLYGKGASWGSWYRNPFLSASLVASLLASGDAQRFAALWRSDLPYPRALAQAYGKPAAVLLRDITQKQWKVAPHGPHITTRVVTAAVGWLAVALGLAIVAGRRRQARS